MVSSKEKLFQFVADQIMEDRAIPLIQNESERGEYLFNILQLEKILLSPNIRHSCPVVISLVGSQQCGKSTLANYIVKYLSDAKGSPSRQSCTGKETLFPVKHGVDTGTAMQMYIWSKAFWFDLDGYGKQVPVLLMDTEGIINSNMSKINGVMSAIHVLMTRAQVFNVKTNLNEEDLRKFELFMELGIQLLREDVSVAGENLSTPIRRLIFLIRDWAGAGSYKYGKEGGADFLTTKMQLKTGRPEGNRLRGNIKSYAKKLDCFLMPYNIETPGEDSEGDMSLTSQSFKKAFEKKMFNFVQYLVNDDMLYPQAGDPTGEQLFLKIKAFYYAITRAPYVFGQVDSYEALRNIQNNKVLERAKELLKERLSGMSIVQSGNLANEEVERKLDDLGEEVKRYFWGNCRNKYGEAEGLFEELIAVIKDKRRIFLLQADHERNENERRNKIKLEEIMLEKMEQLKTFLHQETEKCRTKDHLFQLRQSHRSMIEKEVRNIQHICASYRVPMDIIEKEYRAKVTEISEELIARKENALVEMTNINSICMIEVSGASRYYKREMDKEVTKLYGKGLYHGVQEYLLKEHERFMDQAAQIYLDKTKQLKTDHEPYKRKLYEDCRRHFQTNTTAQLSAFYVQTGDECWRTLVRLSLSHLRLINKLYRKAHDVVSLNHESALIAGIQEFSVHEGTCRKDHSKHKSMLKYLCGLFYQEILVQTQVRSRNSSSPGCEEAGFVTNDQVWTVSGKALEDKFTFLLDNLDKVNCRLENEKGMHWVQKHQRLLHILLTEDMSVNVCSGVPEHFMQILSSTFFSVFMFFSHDPVEVQTGHSAVDPKESFIFPACKMYVADMEKATSIRIEPDELRKRHYESMVKASRWLRSKCNVSTEEEGLLKILDDIFVEFQHDNTINKPSYTSFLQSAGNVTQPYQKSWPKGPLVNYFAQPSGRGSRPDASEGRRRPRSESGDKQMNIDRELPKLTRDGNNLQSHGLNKETGGLGKGDV